MTLENIINELIRKGFSILADTIATTKAIQHTLKEIVMLISGEIIMLTTGLPHWIKPPVIFNLTQALLE